MREYESIYVLNPETTDSAVKDFMVKMKDLVAREGGKNLKADCWGRRKLAWERGKHQRGVYVHHHYLGNPGLVAVTTEDGGPLLGAGQGKYCWRRRCCRSFRCPDRLDSYSAPGLRAGDPDIAAVQRR